MSNTNEEKRVVSKENQVFIDWLTNQIEQHNLNKSELARAVGTSRQAVTNWFKKGSITKANLKSIEVFFGVRSPFTSIDHDHELMKASLTGASLTGASAKTFLGESRVPLVKWSDAQDRTTTDRIPITQLICSVPHSKDTFAVKIKDESMFPHFQINDYLFIDPAVDPVNGSFILTTLEGDSEPVLRQYHREGGKTYLRAVNPAWVPQIIEASSDAVVIGTAVSRFSIL